MYDDAPFTMSNEEILNAIDQMSVFELQDLIEKVKARFNISLPVAEHAAKPVTTMFEPVVEQTEFEVYLKAAGANKLQVIKTVREITNLGLKEAKDLVDKAPSTVKADVAKHDAQAMKAKLEAAGAAVELR